MSELTDIVIDISPKTGVVPAGQHVVCKVVLSAGVEPQLFAINIPCILINQTEKKREERVTGNKTEEQAEFIIQADGTTKLQVRFEYKLF